MKKSQNDETSIEDQLANFTEDILNEKTTDIDEVASVQNPELRALEKTALRLKNAFHDEEPSEITVQRIRKNIIRQWQQTENKGSEPFWKRWMPSSQKWHSKRSRQRLSMALSLSLLVALMLLSIPLLNGNSTDQPATSVLNLNAGLVIIFLGLIFLAIWIGRRKG